VRSMLVAADLNDVWEIDLSGPAKARRGKPGSHVLGVADQFRQRGYVVPNLDALITSSVPIGAGLASSAALEVALATLLERALGVALAPLNKARMCQAAEHAFAGTPCGIMDMYISAAAREGQALLIDCRSEEARPVPADFARHGGALLIVDTGVKHELASGAYAERRETCAQAAAALGRESLRGAAIEDLNIIGLSNAQRRRALHVISENTRTILAAEGLALGDLQRLGELMLNSHASLRDLYEVSCPELDAIVEAAAKMRKGGEGVFGARMTGGGFGGCAIVLCAAGAIDRVKDRVRGAFVERFGRAPAMFTSAATGGAQAMSAVR
jgi:galactokinase